MSGLLSLSAMFVQISKGEMGVAQGTREYKKLLFGGIGWLKGCNDVVSSTWGAVVEVVGVSLGEMVAAALCPSASACLENPAKSGISITPIRRHSIQTRQ